MPSGKARFHKTIGKQPFFWNRSRHSQLTERKEEINRDMKRQMKEKGVIGDRMPYSWEWCYNDKFGIVTGFTRSQARGEIKKVLGIPKNKSLPCEVIIQRINFNESTA